MAEDNSLDRYYEILQKYSEEVIKPFFGTKNFGSSVSSGSDGGDGALTVPSFYSLKDTDYYHTGNNKFIHFTSLDNLFHIVNSGYLIASQLSSLDDPLELKFASKYFESLGNKNQFDELKEKLFSLSMCNYVKSEGEADSDSFSMWKKYGYDGRGIGVIFSFQDNFLDWNDAYLAAVKYGNENDCLDKFTKFKIKHEDFIKQYPKFILRKNSCSFNAGIPDIIGIFLTFHKSRLYADETEIRFIKSFIGGTGELSPQNKSIGIKLNSKNESRYFYKIPILNRESIVRFNEEPDSETTNIGQPGEPYDKFIHALANNKPLIKIEKVILGYRYTDDDLAKIESCITSEVYQKLNFDFKGFELSNLSKKFYG